QAAAEPGSLEHEVRQIREVELHQPPPVADEAGAVGHDIGHPRRLSEDSDEARTGEQQSEDDDRKEEEKSGVGRGGSRAAEEESDEKREQEKEDVHRTDESPDSMGPPLPEHSFAGRWFEAHVASEVRIVRRGMWVT